LVLCVLSGSTWAAKLPDVVVTGDPVAPSPTQTGTGLCVANSVSTDPAADFPQSASSYIGGMNDFMERTAASRTTYVLRSRFDLSNNNTGGPQASRGDFVDAIQGCASYGCNFFINDPFTSFGSRIRGYLNVTPEMLNRPLHFGLYTDDAVSLVIFDKNNVQYQVINRPPQLGLPTWRTTNSVTFQKSGLYPIELLYAEVSEHAALEFSLFEGTFTDFERAATQTPIVKLNEAGFSLVAPERFFQTETGRPSFPDNPSTPQDELSQCQQCNRANANAPGNGGCGANSGYYCNGAALCAPCDTARTCGPSCSPCGQSTPNCVNVNGTFTCVECTGDSQCPNGRCDLSTHSCRGCSDSADCTDGKVCDLPSATCVECNADSQCPTGEVCDLPSFTCVQCSTDAQCPGGRCDTAAHVCKGCNADSQCPTGKVCNLPNSTCVECTANNQCPGGKGCNLATLTCVECTADSQCSGGKVCNLATLTCVECNLDSQCSNGRCDLSTRTCRGCNDNADCGSGRVCDLSSFSCVECTRNEDCAANQVCSPELKQCRQCTPADGCGGDEPDEPEPPGNGCGCGTSDTAGSAFLMMALVASFLFRLLRRT
jgi:outer membrane exchange protein TraA